MAFISLLGLALLLWLLNAQTAVAPVVSAAPRQGIVATRAANVRPTPSAADGTRGAVGLQPSMSPRAGALRRSEAPGAAALSSGGGAPASRARAGSAAPAVTRAADGTCGAIGLQPPTPPRVGALRQSEGPGDVPGWTPSDGRFTLLVAGLDRDPESRDARRRSEGHTDALMLLTTEMGTGDVKALHIPRDSLVQQGGYVGKINGVNLALGRTGLVRAVEGLTGLRADDVLVLDFARFRHAVGVAGPLRMWVDRFIPSPEGDVAVAPGWHRLTARPALAVVRFRHEPLGDIGRVHRQERFLRAAVQLASRMPYGVFQRAIRLADPQFPSRNVRLAYAAVHPLHSYEAHSVPGVFGVGAQASYWIPDHAGARLQSLWMTNPGAARPAIARWRERRGAGEVDDGRDRSQ